MKTIFVVHTFIGWGKGETLTEAWKEYNRVNGKPKKGATYGLTVWKTKDSEDVGLSSDGMNTYHQPESIKLLSTTESIV